jgi:hypothetical protein
MSAAMPAAGACVGARVGIGSTPLHRSHAGFGCGVLFGQSMNQR